MGQCAVDDMTQQTWIYASMMTLPTKLHAHAKDRVPPIAVLN